MNEDADAAVRLTFVTHVKSEHCEVGANTTSWLDEGLLNGNPAKQ